MSKYDTESEVYTMDTNSKNKTKRLPGFYIALTCCMLAVGLAGFLSKNASAPEQEQRRTAKVVTAPATMPPDPSDEAAEETETAPEAEKASAIEEYAVDNPDTAPAAVIVNAAEGVMGDPVPPAAILTGFSDGTLTYSETFSDWRTHNGIDISADIGCSVSSAADGTVTETGMGSMGGYVTIDHGNDITAVYAQLGDINVITGDAVKAGSVIGTIAEPRGEGGAPHLHYEIIRNGSYVDPEKF
ncbi:MAG: M23 family metallopeptidase [Clostridia bacterium]|nr:M23 family metallopeptidase [Clostridia bacterium]